MACKVNKRLIGQIESEATLGANDRIATRLETKRTGVLCVEEINLHEEAGLCFFSFFMNNSRFI